MLEVLHWAAGLCERIANCMSTILRQQCGGQVDLPACKPMDGSRVQSDYILTDVRACVEYMWHDQLIRIGLDRGCVQCVLLCGGVKPHLGNTRLNLKIGRQF